MVLVADRCYGVTYDNKTSSIDVARREEALNFVEETQAAAGGAGAGASGTAAGDAAAAAVAAVQL